MPDYSKTRSEYMKIMMGDRQNALAPYRPEQMNDLGDTSFDVASLSDDDINLAISRMTGTQFEGTDLFSSLQSEQASRKQKAEDEKREKSWLEQIGDFFSNIGTSITEGVLNVVDNVWDFTVGTTAGLFGGGWFGAQNDFTDWAAKAMTDDRWVDYATKALTQPDVFDKGFWTNEGGYWSDWSHENIVNEQNRDYEGMDWLHKGGNFVGELIPSLILAYFTGGASIGAQAAIQGGFGFARAYGNAASQALNEGASFQQSAGYGALSGAVEAAFSAGSVAVGGMLASKGSQGFMKAASNQFASTMTQRFGKGIGTAAGKAMEIALDALGEATEETVENLLDPAFRMIYDQDAWYNAYGTAENRQAYLQEVGKAALMAAVGSIIAGGFKEGVQVRKHGVANYVSDYQAEIESSAKFRALKKSNPKLAQEYITGQIKYARLSQEESDFQRQIEKLTKKAISDGKATMDSDGKVIFSDSETEAKINGLINEHTIKMTEKFSEWNLRYGDSFEKATKAISGEFVNPRFEPIDESHIDSTDVKPSELTAIPMVTETNANGVEETMYAPAFSTPEEFGKALVAIRDSADGDTMTKLPIPNSDVSVDVSKLTNEEINRISTIKTDDVQTTDNGSKYSTISKNKILVYDGENPGIVEATLSADGTRMVFVVDGEEIPAIGVPLPAAQQAENRYGKQVKKAPPSLIVEVAQGKEGLVFSHEGTKNFIDDIEWYVKDLVENKTSETDADLDAVIQKIMAGQELPSDFGKTADLDINKSDLTSRFFAMLNLSSDTDKTSIKNYLVDEILDTDVKVTDVDGKSETFKLINLLDTDERAMLQSKLDEAFDELMANGKTSRYSKLLNEYGEIVQRLLGDNSMLRERAKLATETTDAYNALENKLGIRGKPSQVKSILKNLSSEDVQIVDLFREIVRGTKISSRTGLTTSPIAAERLVDFADKFTYENFGHTYLWDDAIRSELAAIKFLASEYTITRKGETITKVGFHPNVELDLETQTHIKNLLKAINSKLTKESFRIYQQRQATAGDSIALYSAVKPSKRIPVVSNAIDTAESFASYMANYIGKENPAYDALVSDWVKANGTQLSYQQKYTDVANRILTEEGFKPNKGLNFLKKKVEFKGQKITKGEAASIYFSALTKQGIADGDNTLVLFDPSTDSLSKSFKLDGKSDLEALKGFFTESEFRVLERLQKEVIGGVMQKDFVSWFQNKYGYTPETSDDYFMLQASSQKSELATERGATGAGMLMGNTWGRARSRQEYNGAYRIIDFRNQFAQYGNDLAHYIGYADYNDNARVILNTKVEVNGEKLSLNDLLSRTAPNWSGNQKNGGKGWKRYFEYIATDSKAYDSGSGLNGLVGEVMRRGQTSVLGLNPRSMAKQWLSDFTVMGDVGIGTYLKSKARVPYNLSHYKQIRDFMINANNLIDTTNPDFAEYEPYFAIIRERLLNKGATKGELSSNTVGKISDIALKGMAFFDEANNVINVWAVAETLAHDYDGLRYGTEANKLQAMKYFTDLVFRTQSNNNAMYVSQLRSGYAGPIQRLLFGLFASDNQNRLQQVDAITREFYQAGKRKAEYQRIVDDINSTPEQVQAARKAIAYLEKNYSGKAWAKKSSGVVAGLALSGLGAALINETFDRILTKKDKDGNPKKLEEGLDWKTILSEAPLEAFVNWIPYIGTIANAVENNTDVSFFAADRINGLKESATTLFTALQSGDSSKIGKAVTQFIMTYGELLGLPLNNVYKYSKGIIRNIDEAYYLKTFAWMDGLKSNNVSASFKTLVEKNDISGASDVLSISYALYKTGNTDRETLVELSKLVREGFNPIARNVPDYVMNENNEKVMLSDDQKSDFMKVYSRSNAQVAKLIKQIGYKNMDSESKAKAIKKVYDLYYEAARSKALGIDPDSRLGKLLAYASDYDDDIIATLLLIHRNSQLADNRRSTKKEQAVRLVNSQSMARVQKLLTLYLMGYGVTSDNKKQVQRYLVSLGFTKKQAEEFLPS